MVMPSSGPISMAQAHAEFGLGYSLSAYYGCDVGVPTSGPISLGHLYGKKKRTPYMFYRIHYFIYGGENPRIAELELKSFDGGSDLIPTNAPIHFYQLAAGSHAGAIDNDLTSPTVLTAGVNSYFYVGLSGAAVVRQMTWYPDNAAPNNFSGFDIYGANSVNDVSYGSNLTLLAQLRNLPMNSGWNKVNF